MVMGKGGVGKTTVAAAVAVSLAKRGMPVHLTTTDPAQHIWETLQSEVAGLRVSYIDPNKKCDNIGNGCWNQPRRPFHRKACALRGGVEVALLRGSGRISSLLAHRYGSEEGVGGHRYRPNRPYASLARHRRRLPPASDAADGVGPGRIRTPLMMLQIRSTRRS